MTLIKHNDKLPVVDPTAKIFQNAVLSGDITVGKNVNIWFNASLRGDMAPIFIGENTNIQDNAVVHTNLNLPTHIGKNVTVGHGAIIHACTVEDDCLIGMGSIILDGAVIRKGALIGAGAVIPPNKEIPANSLVVGNPMRIIRVLTETELEANKSNKDFYLKLMSEYK
ncbi:2,3,4,5-tetrahydropyridine-2,6-dicarboxylate N-acetyltransferase [Candidatus Izimaplasma bacterium HR1]|jgi:carbonic anhydrase/acetyltransferase-like protein (isoleucine patch superfamily)|uniref:gamma carbonic anhydrase family protein n=1 Tax=Candidatus Izimoplasma sp. HR1 TaxID=1541959 RepID=UPI0004F8522D|nr:2,3,4,5-tetrahydropyridine-2,6-dicarboxylate N-acetyltransferase [Candidatus Izimaplasma bacterium HR1]